MINWAYIAGFIDCDGWVTSVRGSSYSIGMTQSDIFIDKMKKISDFLTINEVRHSFIVRKTMTMIRGVESQRHMVNIHIKEQKSLVKVCESILPFSLIKEDKVQDCLRYAKLRLEKRGVGLEPISKQLRKEKWTKAEIDVLVSMKINGYGNKYIASKLGRSVDSIAQKFCKLSR